MKSKWNWTGKRFGRKLLLLHRGHAWIFLLLAVSGILLSIGTIRGMLGEGRVWLKQLHIWIGVVGIAILILYGPLTAKHWATLKKFPKQQFNLAFTLFLLLGWIVSGLIMTFYPVLPPVLTNTATIVHGLFSWIGIPYAIYHSLTRMQWVKKAGFSPAVQTQKAEKRVSPRPVPGRPPVSRRAFIRVSVGAGIAVLMLILLGRQIGGFFGFHTGERGPNNMSPQPLPRRESREVIGGGSDGDFRVYTVTDIPSFTTDSFHFQVDGLVDKPMNLNWFEFLALKREVQVSDFHCVTGWSVFNNTWEGIKLRDLLDQAGIKNTASHVKFYSADKVYTDSLPLDQALLEDIMVVVLHDGKPIPQDLGGPVRLVTPRMYAYKSVKWLERIELIDYQHVGYWEERGYDIDARI